MTHSQARLLYVNGVRASRARQPNQGDYRLHTWDVPRRRIEVDLNEIAPWERLHEVEMNVQKQWNQNILRVATVALTGAKAFVTPAEPERTRSFTQTAPPRERNQPYHLENAFEFLDAPGEWYLNTPDARAVSYRQAPQTA